MGRWKIRYAVYATDGRTRLVRIGQRTRNALIVWAIRQKLTRRGITVEQALLEGIGRIVRAELLPLEQQPRPVQTLLKGSLARAVQAALRLSRLQRTREV